MSVAKPFCIHVDHLKTDEVEEISEALSPDFLELLPSDDVKAVKPIAVKGEAYIAGDYLIVSLHIATQLQIPCAVCNEVFSFTVDLPDFVYEEPLEDIKHGVFDFAELVRETVLLEVPFYPQCGGTSCLNRAHVEKFLKKKEAGDEEEGEGYQPFRDIYTS